jgi:chloride channel protein, CIC family
VAFYRLIDAAYVVLYLIPAVYLTQSGFLAYRPLLTAAGFAIAWAVMRGPGGGYEGCNIPDVRRAIAREGGRIPPRPALAGTAASAITLVAAGTAAGISAAFNAPLAGAFFALEEILGSLAVSAFPPVVVASVVAAVVSHSFLGNHPAFPIPVEYGFALKREVFVFYPFLGIVAGAVAALFVRVYFGTEALVRRLPILRALLPWVGGSLVGALVLLSKGLLVGHGHFAVHLALVAADVATPAETVTPGDSLLDAVRKMGVRGTPTIPWLTPAPDASSAS